MRLPMVFPLVLAVLASTAHAAQPAQVFVLGSLYSRHKTVQSYDLDALRRVVLAIDPDVIVTDCTPTEIREQKVHVSKIEYPQVIFPLVQQHGYRVYAGEPDEPLFTQIVRPLAQERSAFAAANPEKARALEAYEEATWSALETHWRSPADAHDETTALALAGRKALDTRVYGELSARGNTRWIEHWVRIVRQAVAENPGKKILAVPGIDNRAEIERELRGDSKLTLVDMAQWLQGK
ncbi:MAG TPA: hypothetical protein VFO35_12350 [Steroidobacteraceae bacterium]|nr:hypothetical protein [Steroidobacteraceae bacterium]